MSKVDIIPAILPMDFGELEDHIELIKGLVKVVQVDVCDGQFTGSASWPYRKHDDSFEKISKEELGLPGWESLNYEFDLMANKPEEIVDEWVSSGAMRVIVHAEAKGDIAAALLKLDGKVEVGLAMNIETSLDILELHQNRIQFVQCMGIDNVGFQGQAFDERAVAKVREIRSKFPDMTISVDGGVSFETAPKLIEAGVNRLVIGSAIFESDNYAEAIARFKKLGV